MPARGMAAHDEGSPEPRQFARRHSHLLDNLIDGHIGAKIVAWNGDADAVGIQPASEMAEKGTVERLPVTAMNEDDNRPFPDTGKEINDVACAGTVGNRARCVLLAPGRRVACPTGN